MELTGQKHTKKEREQVYQKQYRKKHIKKVKAYQQGYRKEHAKDLALYQKEYRKKNKERIRISKQQYEKKNKVKIRLRRLEYKKDFIKYKQTLCCARCGISGKKNPEILDFHHKDPSTKKFGIAWQGGKFPAQSVVDEITKCLVLCANCHRIEHTLLRKEANK